MDGKRRVSVDGEEFEVELEQDGDMWKATVEGKTFEIQVPDAGPAPKQRRASGGKSKKSEAHRHFVPFGAKIAFLI